MDKKWSQEDLTKLIGLGDKKIKTPNEQIYRRTYQVNTNKRITEVAEGRQVQKLFYDIIRSLLW